MALSLKVVTESSTAQPARVYPDFETDPRFNSSWWSTGSAKSPVSYCRFLDGDEEVSRAKVLPGCGEYRGYMSWDSPLGGVTEIDLIEVRVDLRRSDRDYGRQTVAQIASHYGDPVVAMSLDEASDRFWRALGWTAHFHPDDDTYRSYSTLFTSI